jgi:hypothetical protein
VLAFHHRSQAGWVGIVGVQVTDPFCWQDELVVWQLFGFGHQARHNQARRTLQGLDASELRAKGTVTPALPVQGGGIRLMGSELQPTVGAHTQHSHFQTLAGQEGVCCVVSPGHEMKPSATHRCAPFRDISSAQGCELKRYYTIKKDLFKTSPLGLEAIGWSLEVAASSLR